MSPTRLLPAMMILMLLGAAPAPDPAAAPKLTYHLTSRPWQSADVPASAFLDLAEPLARAIAKFQNAKGQIIDPYEKREIQYSTAYFAYGVASLVNAGRGNDLLNAGIAAMDSATDQFSRGADAIDNQAGEFVITPLCEAIPLYAPKVAAGKVTLWKRRMSRPREGALRGLPNNWQAYAMRGEWLRAKAGFIAREDARTYIESAWKDGQVKRLTDDPWNLYHDDTSDPDALAVDPVGRDNLMALIIDGYDGPSAPKMKELLFRGARNSLFMQDPTGQAPGGGRSSGHVWNDLATLVSNQQLEQLAVEFGEAGSAGRFRRAADLALQSMKRWQRPDGSFWVTKNRFDPSQRVGYSRASFFTNYNGALLFHLMEAYAQRKMQAAVMEQPAPAEVGDYVLATDPAFASVFANAGGMQIQGFLRGSTQIEKKQYWTTLGITRFSRAGWDSRLGAVEATRDVDQKIGVSFSPVFKENGRWVRLLDLPARFEGHLSITFVSAVLARFSIDYRPTAGHMGPAFHHAFIVTPDGVLSTLSAEGIAAGEFGVMLPLLENDGSGPTKRRVGNAIASVQYVDGRDQLAYLAIKPAGGADAAATLESSDAAIRGCYGSIRPVRFVSSAAGGSVFIYPRMASDPSVEDVAASFKKSGDDFASVLGRVTEDVFVGRTSAGGFGKQVDLDNDGRPDIAFSEEAGFICQLSANRSVTSVEVDRALTSTVAGREFELRAFTPVTITPPPSKGP